MALQSSAGAQIAGQFQGFTIYQNESGFFWQQGGYYDDLAECQDDIADWNHAQAEYPHEDSPSLGEPWWSRR